MSDVYVSKVKRILVTGGAWFLGSHLCETLMEEGHDVVCVELLTAGVDLSRR